MDLFDEYLSRVRGGFQCSVSLATRKKQIKSTLRFHLTLSRIDIIKSQMTGWRDVSYGTHVDLRSSVRTVCNPSAGRWEEVREERGLARW